MPSIDLNRQTAGQTPRLPSENPALELPPAGEAPARLFRSFGLGLLACLAVLSASVVYTQAQWMPSPATTPMAQRNAMNLLVNQVGWFQNTTRTASAYRGGGYEMLTQQFQAVRDQYNGLKSTLNPMQLNSGANQLAELDSGLAIIQEAFADYQNAVANGQSQFSAFSNMSRVLNEAMGVWLQELKRDCSQLRVGW